MLDFQQRVVNEKSELDARICKLTDFILARNQPNVFDSLPQDEQSRLNVQLAVMRTYSIVLSERIANFKVSEKNCCCHH